MISIVLTQQINKALGTTLAPWELVELPDDWIDALKAYIYELPGYVSARQQVQKKLEAWRNKHPGYRTKK